MTYTSGNYAKHTSRNPLQKWLIRRFHASIVRMLRKTNAKTIFEAGCGEGFSSGEIISASQSRFTGLDIEAAMILLARKKHSAGFFLQGDILSIPFMDASFDLVVSLEVLEHLEDPLSALGELCRVSKRWLILSVPNEPFFRLANFMRGKNLRTWGNDPGHIRHWSSQSFVQFVEKRCRVVERTLSFPWTVLLCKIK